MEASVNYKLTRDGAEAALEGEAKAVLNDQYLNLTVSLGEPLLFSYSDIIDISEHDYQIDILTASKEQLTLGRLGYQYEDFLFQLFKLRNELLLKYLLMQESLLQDQFYGQYTRTYPPEQLNQGAACEIRLYDNALVVLPQKADPIRLPYCYISQITKGDYKITVASEFGEGLVFSMLGEKFDPLTKALSDAYTKMMNRTQENIKTLLPEANTLTLSKLASLMKDGKAASRRNIEPLASNFWTRLTGKISEAGLTNQIDYLSSLAQKDQVCVGVKRGLMGDLTGQYIWLLFPLVNDQNRLGNAVALEAFTVQEETEKPKQQPTTPVEDSQDETQQNGSQDQTLATVGATYFFRLMCRKEYVQTNSEEVSKRAR